MPKNLVTDPITDQEMAFARLILSGTMNDRDAAEVAGLNPSTAAYTKSKPRVRAYMTEHRAAVNEKLADDEAEDLRTVNRSREQIRDQMLDRLWQLANLSPELTRGSIAGQIKAMSMILAIEGLIPDRRLSPAQAQPAAQPVKAQIYKSEPMRRQQAQAEGRHLEEAESAERPSPLTPAGDGVTSHLDHTNPFAYPAAMSVAYDANLNLGGPLRLPVPPGKAAFARGR